MVAEGQVQWPRDDANIDRLLAQGGTSDAQATWAKEADGRVTMTFGDGNAWELTAPTADSAPAAEIRSMAAASSQPSSPILFVGIVAIAAVAGFAFGQARPSTQRSFSQMDDQA